MAHKKKTGWKINLSVVTKPKPGYMVSNEPGYYYKFSGGNNKKNKNGDLLISKGNRNSEGITVEIALIGSSNKEFQIRSASLKSGSSSNDIKFSKPKNNKITMTDTEQTDDEEVSFNVIVNPKRKTSPDIICDPTVRHVWR